MIINRSDKDKLKAKIFNNILYKDRINITIPNKLFYF